MSGGRRAAAHEATAAVLSRLDDREVVDLLATAVPLGEGIGGTAAVVDVGGTPVFVKRVPVTAREARPENAGSTANLFGLPAFCHYGVGDVGSPGFGVWREVAVHAMTTEWVLAGEYDGFPLTYHWRVLAHPGLPLSGELADIDHAVDHWGGGPGVRDRIEGLRDARASVALFLEHVPHTLHDWLRAQVAAGERAAERACAMVERELLAGTSFLDARGVLHFDAHFQNILTDGERLYFADFGLALSSGFAVDGAEAAFRAGHRGYDRCYALTQLVVWLVVELFGLRGDELGAFLRACARGEPPAGVPGWVRPILLRHAPVAAVMTDFFRRFRAESRQTPYPAERLAGLLG
ncbi:hypothetical protein ACFPM7_11400 [Actinokineospora guangxiensis]|uniref:Protein kinase domain-containing protein n=1 Tax=Actinokineospora guangxiensis TaxID=1490288 RepID=A0ABW0END8_9PSEU